MPSSQGPCLPGWPRPDRTLRQHLARSPLLPRARRNCRPVPLPQHHRGLARRLHQSPTRHHRGYPRQRNTAVAGGRPLPRSRAVDIHAEPGRTVATFPSHLTPPGPPPGEKRTEHPRCRSASRHPRRSRLGRVAHRLNQSNILPYEQDQCPHALTSPAVSPKYARTLKAALFLTSKPGEMLPFYPGPNSLRTSPARRRSSCALSNCPGSRGSLCLLAAQQSPRRGSSGNQSASCSR